MAAPQTQQVIGLLFRSLHFNLQSEVEKSLKTNGFNLSFGHIAPMIELGFNPGSNGAQLARQGMVSAQSMNSILRKLALQDLVEKRPHPESLRADSWHLTTAGELCVEQVTTVLDGVFAKMLSNFSKSDVSIFQDYLVRCNGALGS